ncbi:hypothetical protein O3M35_003496 [Rhynocoris fuscipes]|uniref:Uncharacterized protein n=1 Tax=Rhynocoris fuscipes TaxID=488301 RepID=A0AAW1CLK9_9HEMI
MFFQKLGLKIRRMQPATNAVRPTTAEGNGIWISSNSNSESPLPPQILYANNGNATVYKNKSRKRIQRLLFISASIICILFLALCIAVYFVAEMKERGNICFSSKCVKAAATLLNSMDSSVNPCDNFYKFACGNWRSTHPADEPLFVNNWFQLSYKIQRRDAIDFLEQENKADEPQCINEARMVYRACLDFDSMEVNGLPALWSLLDNLGLPRNPLTNKDLIQPWIRSVAKVRRYIGVDLLVGTGILPSLTNSSLNNLVVGVPADEQVLPGTRWRWEDKVQLERFKKKLKDEGDQIVKGWKKYATKLIEYVIEKGDNTSTVDEQLLMDAAYMLLDINREVLLLQDEDSVRQASLQGIPDVYTMGELQNIVNNASKTGASKLNWKDFFGAIYEDISEERMDFDDSEPIIVQNLPYILLVAELVDNTDDKTLELLVWWTVIYAVAPHVNEDMKELKEIFVKKILEIPAAESRKEICSDTVSKLMSGAVGWQVTYFAKNETIEKVIDILKNVRSSFGNFIYALDWMDEPTKTVTIEKLYSMNMYIGYPKWYNDWDLMNTLYANVSLKNDTHLENVLNLLNELLYEELSSLDYVNTLSSDVFDPLDINAYYDPTSNTITVPYGLLQQPYYDMGLEALNYGAIGTILGHELTHGLDNTGRMYDKFGNYRVWWSNYSSEEYTKREDCYQKMYSNFYLEHIDQNVDGAKTLGENIADDGGVRDALAAYKSYVKKNGKEAKLPGFKNYTHDQLFFLSFANMWCSEYSDEALVRTAQDDEHSPNFVRVLVVLQNYHEFSETWNCPKGSYMNPEKKCNLWI